MHESSSLLLKASQWVLRDTVPATPRVHFPKPSTYPNVIASTIQIHPQQSWHEIFTFKLPPSLQNNESVASLTHCSHKQAPRRVCRGQAVCFACLFFSFVFHLKCQSIICQEKSNSFIASLTLVTKAQSFKSERKM